MAGWILLTLWLPLNSSAVQPMGFRHVRSSEAPVRNLIAEGYARSATFRALVDAVDDLPCVVYIASAVKLSQGMRGALLHLPGPAREMPVLRVLIKTNLATHESIAVIGHELQHVIEAVTAPAAEARLDVTAAFDRLDPSARAHGSHKYDTALAISMTARVIDELKQVKR